MLLRNINDAAYEQITRKMKVVRAIRFDFEMFIVRWDDYQEFKRYIYVRGGKFMGEEIKGKKIFERWKKKKWNYIENKKLY